MRAYLDSKKLTLDHWLDAVKNNRRGDTLCVYFLSLVTGRHTIVHLKGGINWCTLKVIPLLHEELIERCDIHLVYLGFGVFLRLNRRPPIDVNVLPILGHVSSDQPDVMARLVASGIKQEPIFTGSTLRQPRCVATALAGSEAQLPHVEVELKAEPSTGASPKSPNPATTPKVNVLPFTVNLTRLTRKEIDKYTKKPRITDKPDLTIVVHKLPLQPQQTVILAPPKQPRTPVSPAITHSKTWARAPKVPKWTCLE